MFYLFLVLISFTFLYSNVLCMSFYSPNLQIFSFITDYFCCKRIKLVLMTCINMYMYMEVFSPVLLCFSLCLLAASTGSSVDRPRLVFSSNEEFKLAVFADCKLQVTHTHPHLPPTHTHTPSPPPPHTHTYTCNCNTTQCTMVKLKISHGDLNKTL